MLICKFCGKEFKNNRGLSNHTIRCKENPDRKIQVITEEGKEKLRQHNRNKKESGFYTEEYRKKISHIMKQVVLDNPDSYSSNNVCGRIKIQDYKGEKFHGKWELEVAKWFDEINVKWERKIEPIKYFWNNDWHLYFPDFYLPEYDLYVEVKGYETDRDTAKWNSLSNLKVLKNKEISLIKERKYPPVTHW